MTKIKRIMKANLLVAMKLLFKHSQVINPFYLFSLLTMTICRLSNLTCRILECNFINAYSIFFFCKPKAPYYQQFNIYQPKITCYLLLKSFLGDKLLDQIFNKIYFGVIIKKIFSISEYIKLVQF